MVTFCILIMWMVGDNFHTSKEREITQGNIENMMYQFAFESLVGGLTEETSTDDRMREIAESIANQLQSKGVHYSLYNRGKTLLYSSQNIGMTSHIFDSLKGNQICGYEIMNIDGNYVLSYLAKVEHYNTEYYLQTSRDITKIYTDRNEMLRKNRTVLCILIVITSMLSVFISHLLTKGIRNLSKTTKLIADGELVHRARITSSDEVGKLAEDFNRMADRLEEQIADLTMAAKKQEDFTASFAHELKTPLTSIIGYADMIRSVGLSQEDTMEAANYIFTQGKRLESLSYKLLELIAFDKGGVERKEIEIEQLVNNVRNIMVIPLQAKQLNLDVKVQGGNIRGDFDLMTSLLVNLLDNARKVSNQGQTIHILGRAGILTYTLQIVDHGCGMPEEEIKRIVEPFYMVNKSRSRKEGGAGLGITICNKILQLHNAEWKIDSTQGVGTTVTIVLGGKEYVE